MAAERLRKAQAAFYGEEIPAMILFGTGLDLDSATDDTYSRRSHSLSEPPVRTVRQGGNVQVPMMVQPPAGWCTWRVVRT
jgi:hypothetical protein